MSRTDMPSTGRFEAGNTLWDSWTPAQKALATERIAKQQARDEKKRKEELDREARRKENDKKLEKTQEGRALIKEAKQAEANDAEFFKEQDRKAAVRYKVATQSNVPLAQKSDRLPGETAKEWSDRNRKIYDDEYSTLDSIESGIIGGALSIPETLLDKGENLILQAAGKDPKVQTSAVNEMVAEKSPWIAAGANELLGMDEDYILRRKDDSLSPLEAKRAIEEKQMLEAKQRASFKGGVPLTSGESSKLAEITSALGEQATDPNSGVSGYLKFQADHPALVGHAVFTELVEEGVGLYTGSFARKGLMKLGGRIIDKELRGIVGAEKLLSENLKTVERAATTVGASIGDQAEAVASGIGSHDSMLQELYIARDQALMLDPNADVLSDAEIEQKALLGGISTYGSTSLEEVVTMGFEKSMLKPLQAGETALSGVSKVVKDMAVETIGGVTGQVADTAVQNYLTDKPLTEGMGRAAVDEALTSIGVTGTLSGAREAAISASEAVTNYAATTGAKIEPALQASLTKAAAAGASKASGTDEPIEELQQRTPSANRKQGSSYSETQSAFLEDLLVQSAQKKSTGMSGEQIKALVDRSKITNESNNRVLSTLPEARLEELLNTPELKEQFASLSGVSSESSTNAGTAADLIQTMIDDGLIEADEEDLATIDRLRTVRDSEINDSTAKLGQLTTADSKLVDTTGFDNVALQTADESGRELFSKNGVNGTSLLSLSKGLKAKGTKAKLEASVRYKGFLTAAKAAGLDVESIKLDVKQLSDMQGTTPAPVSRKEQVANVESHMTSLAAKRSARIAEAQDTSNTREDTRTRAQRVRDAQVTLDVPLPQAEVEQEDSEEVIKTPVKNVLASNKVKFNKVNEEQPSSVKVTDRFERAKVVINNLRFALKSVVPSNKKPEPKAFSRATLVLNKVQTPMSNADRYAKSSFNFNQYKTPTTPSEEVEVNKLKKEFTARVQQVLDASGVSKDSADYKKKSYTISALFANHLIGYSNKGTDSPLGLARISTTTNEVLINTAKRKDSISTLDTLFHELAHFSGLDLSFSLDGTSDDEMKDITRQVNNYIAGIDDGTMSNLEIKREIAAESISRIFASTSNSPAMQAARMHVLEQVFNRVDALNPGASEQSYGVLEDVIMEGEVTVADLISAVNAAISDARDLNEMLGVTEDDSRARKYMQMLHGPYEVYNALITKRVDRSNDANVTKHRLDLREAYMTIVQTLADIRSQEDSEVSRENSKTKLVAGFNNSLDKKSTGLKALSYANKKFLYSLAVSRDFLDANESLYPRVRAIIASVGESMPASDIDALLDKLEYSLKKDLKETVVKATYTSAVLTDVLEMFLDVGTVAQAVREVESMTPEALRRLKALIAENTINSRGREHLYAVAGLMVESRLRNLDITSGSLKNQQDGLNVVPIVQDASNLQPISIAARDQAIARAKGYDEEDIDKALEARPRLTVKKALLKLRDHAVRYKTREVNVEPKYFVIIDFETTTDKGELAKTRILPGDDNYSEYLKSADIIAMSLSYVDINDPTNADGSPKIAKTVTKINDSMAAFNEMQAEIHNASTTEILVAHNSAFELAVIMNKFSTAGTPIIPTYGLLDTMHLAGVALPGTSKNLDAALSNFNVKDSQGNPMAKTIAGNVSSFHRKTLQEIIADGSLVRDITNYVGTDVDATARLLLAVASPAAEGLLDNTKIGLHTVVQNPGANVQRAMTVDGTIAQAALNLRIDPNTGKVVSGSSPDPNVMSNTVRKAMEILIYKSLANKGASIEEMHYMAGEYTRMFLDATYVINGVRKSEMNTAAAKAVFKAIGNNMPTSEYNNLTSMATQYITLKKAENFDDTKLQISPLDLGAVFDIDNNVDAARRRYNLAKQREMYEVTMPGIHGIVLGFKPVLRKLGAVFHLGGMKPVPVALHLDRIVQALQDPKGERSARAAAVSEYVEGGLKEIARPTRANAGILRTLFPLGFGSMKHYSLGSKLMHGDKSDAEQEVIIQELTDETNRHVNSNFSVVMYRFARQATEELRTLRETIPQDSTYTYAEFMADYMIAAMKANDSLTRPPEVVRAAILKYAASVAKFNNNPFGFEVPIHGDIPKPVNEADLLRGLTPNLNPITFLDIHSSLHLLSAIASVGDVKIPNGNNVKTIKSKIVKPLKISLGDTGKVYTTSLGAIDYQVATLIRSSQTFGEGMTEQERSEALDALSVRDEDRLFSGLSKELHNTYLNAVTLSRVLSDTSTTTEQKLNSIGYAVYTTDAADSSDSEITDEAVEWLKENQVAVSDLEALTPEEIHSLMEITLPSGESIVVTSAIIARLGSQATQFKQTMTLEDVVQEEESHSFEAIDYDQIIHDDTVSTSSESLMEAAARSYIQPQKDSFTTGLELLDASRITFAPIMHPYKVNLLIPTSINSNKTAVINLSSNLDVTQVGIILATKNVDNDSVTQLVDSFRKTVVYDNTSVSSTVSNINKRKMQELYAQAGISIVDSPASLKALAESRARDLLKKAATGLSQDALEALVTSVAAALVKRVDVSTNKNIYTDKALETALRRSLTTRKSRKVRYELEELLSDLVSTASNDSVMKQTDSKDSSMALALMDESTLLITGFGERVIKTSTPFVTMMADRRNASALGYLENALGSVKQTPVSKASDKARDTLGSNEFSYKREILDWPLYPSEVLIEADEAVIRRKIVNEALALGIGKISEKQQLLNPILANTRNLLIAGGIIRRGGASKGSAYDNFIRTGVVKVVQNQEMWPELFSESFIGTSEGNAVRVSVFNPEVANYDKDVITLALYKYLSTREINPVNSNLVGDSTGSELLQTSDSLFDNPILVLSYIVGQSYDKQIQSLNEDGFLAEEASLRTPIIISKETGAITGEESFENETRLASFLQFLAKNGQLSGLYSSVAGSIVFDSAIFDRTVTGLTEKDQGLLDSLVSARRNKKREAANVLFDTAVAEYLSARSSEIASVSEALVETAFGSVEEMVSGVSAYGSITQYLEASSRELLPIGVTQTVSELQQRRPKANAVTSLFSGFFGPRLGRRFENRLLAARRLHAELGDSLKTARNRFRDVVDTAGPENRKLILDAYFDAFTETASRHSTSDVLSWYDRADAVLEFTNRFASTLPDDMPNKLEITNSFNQFLGTMYQNALDAAFAFPGLAPGIGMDSKSDFNLVDPSVKNFILTEVFSLGNTSFLVDNAERSYWDLAMDNHLSGKANNTTIAEFVSVASKLVNDILYNEASIPEEVLAPLKLTATYKTIQGLKIGTAISDDERQDVVDSVIAGLLKTDSIINTVKKDLRINDGDKTRNVPIAVLNYLRPLRNLYGGDISLESTTDSQINAIMANINDLAMIKAGAESGLVIKNPYIPEGVNRAIILASEYEQIPNWAGKYAGWYVHKSIAPSILNNLNPTAEHWIRDAKLLTNKPTMKVLNKIAGLASSYVILGTQMLIGGFATYAAWFSMRAHVRSLSRSSGASLAPASVVGARAFNYVMRNIKTSRQAGDVNPEVQFYSQMLMQAGLLDHSISTGVEIDIRNKAASDAAWKIIEEGMESSSPLTTIAFKAKAMLNNKTGTANDFYAVFTMISGAMDSITKASMFVDEYRHYADAMGVVDGTYNEAAFLAAQAAVHDFFPSSPEGTLMSVLNNKALSFINFMSKTLANLMYGQFKTLRRDLKLNGYSKNKAYAKATVASVRSLAFIGGVWSNLIAPIVEDLATHTGDECLDALNSTLQKHGIDGRIVSTEGGKATTASMSALNSFANGSKELSGIAEEVLEGSKGQDDLTVLTGIAASDIAKSMMIPGIAFTAMPGKKSDYYVPKAAMRIVHRVTNIPTAFTRDNFSAASVGTSQGLTEIAPPKGEDGKTPQGALDMPYLGKEKIGSTLLDFLLSASEYTERAAGNHQAYEPYAWKMVNDLEDAYKDGKLSTNGQLDRAKIDNVFSDLPSVKGIMKYQRKQAALIQDLKQLSSCADKDTDTAKAITALQSKYKKELVTSKYFIEDVAEKALPFTSIDEPTMRELRTVIRHWGASLNDVVAPSGRVKPIRRILTKAEGESQYSFKGKGIPLTSLAGSSHKGYEDATVTAWKHDSKVTTIKVGDTSTKVARRSRAKFTDLDTVTTEVEYYALNPKTGRVVGYPDSPVKTNKESYRVADIRAYEVGPDAKNREQNSADFKASIEKVYGKGVTITHIKLKKGLTQWDGDRKIGGSGGGFGRTLGQVYLRLSNGEVLSLRELSIKVNNHNIRPGHSRSERVKEYAKKLSSKVGFKAEYIPGDTKL